IFVLLDAGATVLFGLAGSLPLILAARLGMGAAQAGMLSCATSSLSRWYPATQRALTTGVIGSALSVGGAIGAALTGICVPWLGWRWLFVLYALPGLLWAVWFLFWFRDDPQDHPGVNAAELGFIGD